MNTIYRSSFAVLDKSDINGFNTKGGAAHCSPEFPRLFPPANFFLTMKMLASILLLLFSMLAHSNAESVGCKGTGKPSGPSFCFAKKVGTDYICAGDPSTVNRNFKVAGWEVRAAVTITFRECSSCVSPTIR